MQTLMLRQLSHGSRPSLSIVVELCMFRKNKKSASGCLMLTLMLTTDILGS